MSSDIDIEKVKRILTELVQVEVQKEVDARIKDAIQIIIDEVIARLSKTETVSYIQ